MASSGKAGIDNAAVTVVAEYSCLRDREGPVQAIASRSTLLRLVMAAPDPPASAPRVLGITRRG